MRICSDCDHYWRPPLYAQLQAPRCAAKRIAFVDNCDWNFAKCAEQNPSGNCADFKPKPAPKPPKPTPEPPKPGWFTRLRRFLHV